MLLFSTLLNINDTMTKDDFIKLVIEWNQGSPHEENVINDITWSGERNIRYGNEKLWLDIEEYRNQNIVAARYEKVENDGAIWDTDYVMNFNTMQMAIRLDRSFTVDALNLDKTFSTPHFISLLIDRGYIQDDVDLPISRKPLVINGNNLDLIANIINGQASYRLPVVYISKTYHDEDPVKVNLLASKLKGVAHILVQENNCTNSRLRSMCDSKNEYYGAIGVYYTTPDMYHRRYLYYSSVGTDDFLMEKVSRLVIQNSNAQYVGNLFTWQGVNNALLRDRLISQKEERAKAENERRHTLYELLEFKENLDAEKASFHQEAINDAKIEADKILDDFEEELKGLQDQVEQLTHENERLQSENLGLKRKIDGSEGTPILYMGDELDFYPGEIKDLVLSVLSDARISNILGKSRRADIVDDIIQHNDYKKFSEAKADEVKQLLKNYTGMTKHLRASLEQLGFVITDDGKHYKVSYYGDGRYQTSFSKTPSDGRTGKNSSAQIKKTVF